jgi:Lrp/AsnC family leucine-responsive transcriptional regulator
MTIMELDARAWKILAAVQRDGRISLKALAAEAGLSLPAVSERLKRLEEAGVVTGYPRRGQCRGARLRRPGDDRHDDAAGGQGTAAGAAPNAAGSDRMPARHRAGLVPAAHRSRARDIAHLEQLVGTINHYGETRTSIVMSVPIPLRPVAPPQGPHAS